MNRCHYLFLLLLLVVLRTHAVEQLADDEMLADEEQIARFDVCFDFGCKSNQRIYLFESSWRPVRALLINSKSAVQERARIADAIAMMEAIVGEVSPTGVDRARNDVPDNDFSGQMDCIDESTNATTYLQLFQEQGLLKWHRVRERVYRAPLIIDEHWAAQIEELQTGARYVVDSWPREHAVPAVIQAVEQWLVAMEPETPGSDRATIGMATGITIGAASGALVINPIRIPVE